MKNIRSTSLLLLAFLLFTAQQSLSQWIQQTSPVSAYFNSVHFVDSLRGFIGGQTKIIKTVDGGANWTTIHFTGADSTRKNLGIYYGFHFFNSSTGVAVGNSFLDNGSYVLRTTDGGATWIQQYLAVNNSGALYSVHFSGNTGVSVGAGGVIIRTTDGGITWNAISSGINTDLYGVYFADANTVFAVGDGHILKSVNAGQTWTSSVISETLTSVFFTDLNTGYSTTSATGKVWKTTNSGGTWIASDLHVSPVGFSSIFFTSPLIGYIGGSNIILKTTDGGIFWETIPYNPSNIGVECLYFPTSNTGYATGYSGMILKTSNAGGLTAPVASFNTPATICADSVITFTSNGPSGYIYQWLDNNVPFSNSFSTTRTFAASTTHTITLIVTNNNFSDTATSTFTTQSSLSINLNSYPSNDSICVNTSTSFLVTNSEVGALYRLRIGTTNVGASQNGNGGTLTFSTGNLATTTTFNILATKTNACSTNQVTQYNTVYVFPVTTSLTVGAHRDTVCMNDSTYIRVLNTQTGVTYRLRIGATTIGSPLNGNGGTLYFPTGILSANTTFNVLATNFLGCQAQLTQTKLVRVRTVAIAFTPSSSYLFVNDSINFANTSNADTYLWSFGNGSSPSSSTLMTPGYVRYNSAGTSTVALHGYTYNGCSDSLKKNINVYNHVTPFPGTYCNSFQWGLPSYFNQITDTKMDRWGNIYVAGYYLDLNYNRY